MAINGFEDWNGNPINKERYGGLKAAYFIYFMVVMCAMAYTTNMLNMVTYLHGTMHTSIASSSTIVTTFYGVTCAFTLLGGFLSDSYVSRFKTILIFAPFEFLGFAMLAMESYFPSLKPKACNVEAMQGIIKCEQVHGGNEVLLCVALFTIALGEGCLRANLASFGGDQFDSDDPVESQLKSSFFNWFGFVTSLGLLTGLLLIVWIENNKGWDYGFGLSSVLVSIGIAVIASGFRLYRFQIPQGSPLTRMLQVFVAAFRNRKHSFPVRVEEDEGEIQEESDHRDGDKQYMEFKFLDKALIMTDGRNTGVWSHCSKAQVEETKIVLRMLPIFIGSVFGYIPIPLLLTFSVQQGTAMNTKLGKIKISPASLVAIGVILMMILIIIYDRFFVPLARRFTGYTRGITPLQRVGAGFIVLALATSVSALIERRRKHALEMNGVHISVLWLSLQFLILGITEVAAFVGLLEFFNTEISKGMKSLGTAIFWCIIGFSSLLGSALIQVVNRASNGWLHGADLNKSHLDKFYWLLSCIASLSFFNFLYWSKKYTYIHDPHK
ncbi:protein NRT1/ PTR FAMILY 4.4-like [Dioscorea cayenensis subsp. rotundata]|uniref:Protein NRT1/ PTR FAMILY 4.4-like n=1 Tax=Dioscorea cayennensis subsp. rotundata TaxID=55577 RepID=A0AB40C1Z5_DIOCR|nr:protein NRT1/ PTR FAMILY 4.4-like [Dioscorea cayenensis subsp. rotundata]